MIPKWLAAMIAGEAITINGDGETSRDFCFVDNAVQANLLAALAPDEAQGEVFNVAVGQRTTLNQLYGMLRERLAARGHERVADAIHGPLRPGDVRHSEADIAKALRQLGYRPTHDIVAGLDQALPWYLAQQGESAK